MRTVKVGSLAQTLAARAVFGKAEASVEELLDAALAEASGSVDEAQAAAAVWAGKALAAQALGVPEEELRALLPADRDAALQLAQWALELAALACATANEEGGDQDEH